MCNRKFSGVTKNRPIRQQNVPYLGKFYARSTRTKYLGTKNKSSTGRKKAITIKGR